MNMGPNFFYQLTFFFMLSKFIYFSKWCGTQTKCWKEVFYQCCYESFTDSKFFEPVTFFLFKAFTSACNSFSISIFLDMSSHSFFIWSAHLIFLSEMCRFYLKTMGWHVKKIGNTKGITCTCEGLKQKKKLLVQKHLESIKDS